jgi:hypothetical protein
MSVARDHLTAGAHLIDNLTAYLVEAEFVTSGFARGVKPFLAIFI